MSESVRYQSLTVGEGRQRQRQPERRHYQVWALAREDRRLQGNIQQAPSLDGQANTLISNRSIRRVGHPGCHQNLGLWAALATAGDCKSSAPRGCVVRVHDNPQNRRGTPIAEAHQPRHSKPAPHPQFTPLYLGDNCVRGRPPGCPRHVRVCQCQARGRVAVDRVRGVQRALSSRA